MQKKWLAGAWLGVTGVTTAYFALSFFGDDRTLFLPGPSTGGHYQIESKCGLCHTDLSGVKQDACTQCHGEELSQVDDSHPPIKFLDPRNAGLVSRIDARLCVTCHVEHRPEMTLAMGETQPVDFCVYCHDDIAEERPSHQGMAFDTCQDSGCHNYHDNRALNEEFLSKHLDDTDLQPVPVVLRATDEEATAAPASRLTRAQKDSPPDLQVSVDVIDEWERTAHALAGVNCRDCHSTPGPDGGAGAWRSAVDYTVCARCHAQEHNGFLAGRHGMRLAQGLSPMRPELARLPMHAAARGRELVCTHCHGAHAFDTRRAAAEACMECHADRHSLAYTDSPHHELWKAELDGSRGEGTGVSCATCHMPRFEVRLGGKTYVQVDHNQNNTLRPNEKMLRVVCHQCHGLRFSIDSLADPELIRTNFRGRPSPTITTLDMVKAKQK